MKFYWCFNRFWCPFGLQVGAKILPKSEKVGLKIDFRKYHEKYTISGRKSRLPKSKNQAKTMEGCLKSHFSLICNKVQKTTLRDLILGRFLEPKSSQDGQKVFSKTKQKSRWFFIRFFYVLASILDPPGDPNLSFFVFFLSCCQLGSKRVSKVLQDPPGGRFFINFLAFWGSIFEDFLDLGKKINEWMNEWRKEGKKEGMKEWRNEGMKGWRNEGMKEWRNEKMKEWSNEGMKEWMNEWTNEWRKEGMKEGRNGRTEGRQERKTGRKKQFLEKTQVVYLTETFYLH